MDLGLAGKVALVAGSTRGIGLAIAEAFLAEGAAVAITGRSLSALEIARDGLSSKFPGQQIAAILGDMSDEAACQAAIENTERDLGTIVAAVANVGTGTGPVGYSLSKDEWQKGIDTNLQASMVLAGAILPLFVEHRGGSLTFISSIVGVENVGGPLPYIAAKAGLLAAAKTMSREVGRSGVRVNVVSPGNVLFPGGSWERKLKEKPGFFEEMIAREVPLQRFASPSEIADMVVFLASERASFVTGANVIVDGGQTRRF